MAIKKVLILNWKANPNSLGEAVSLASLINQYVPSLTNKYEIAVAVPSLYLIPLIQVLDKSVKLMAQSVNTSAIGPQTGALAPLMLKESGISYSLLGHSEERKRNQLANEEIASLLEANLRNDLKTTLCIGETMKGSKALEEIKQQIDQILLPLIGKYSTLEINNNVVLAYEPLWAIGSESGLNLNYIQKQMSSIKEYLDSKFANNLYLLYGGSVDLENVKQLLDLPVLSGVLIGEKSSQKDWLEDFLQSMI